MNITTITIKIKGRLNRYIQNTASAVRPSAVARSALYHLGWYRLNKKHFAGFHLGSGWNRIPGFVNVDLSHFVNADIVAGVTKLKVADNALGALYASHLFEHTDRTKALAILKEWHRALSPGSNLYVAVPDLEKLFTIYLERIKNYEVEENRATADKACRIIYGGQVNKYDYHFYGYSFITLKYILQRAGFKNIERFDPRQLALLEIGADASFTPISLNIKATKI